MRIGKIEKRVMEEAKRVSEIILWLSEGQLL